MGAFSFKPDFASDIRCRVHEMAQWVKELAAKPDDPSSIPRPYMVEGETNSLKSLTWVRDRETQVETVWWEQAKGDVEEGPGTITQW